MTVCAEKMHKHFAIASLHAPCIAFRNLAVRL